MSGEQPWHDAETLHELHHEEGLTYEEMGERLGCSTSCVGKWMTKLDVDARSPGRTPAEVFQTPSKLRELYWDQGLSLSEIAERVDSDPSTVRHFMQKHSIECRSRSESGRKAMLTGKLPYYGMDDSGHMYWDTSYQSERWIVQTHRLLAVAKYGLEAVEGMEVHHKNHIPWDNRIENIELMTPSNHSKHHSTHL